MTTSMLVLAGGFGTRLRAVVEGVPKPLAPVGSAPFLRHQIEHWIAQGCGSFVFLLHHQAELIVSFLDGLKDNVLKDCDVNWLVEETPLDTGGAVAFAVRELSLDADFVVTNADTWLGTGIRPLSETGANVMGVVRQEEVARYGQVDFNERGIVTGFREKGTSAGQGWINAGMCLLHADCFKPWDGQRLSLERDVFPALVAAGELKAQPLDTAFIDIGVPEDYARFCRWQEGGRKGIPCN